MLYACIVHDAVHSKSIVSESFWFLSMGSTSRKNTVCLLLKFWDLQMSIPNYDGMWIDYTSDIVNVLGEVAKKIVHWHWVLKDLEKLGGTKLQMKTQYNTGICFLYPPPPAMLFFYLSSDQSCQCKKCFWTSSLILQHSIAPSSSLGRFPWLRRWINFLRHCVFGEWIVSSFNIGPHFFSNRNCSRGRTGKFSLFSGFASALHRHAEYTCIQSQCIFFELHF